MAASRKPTAGRAGGQNPEGIKHGEHKASIDSDIRLAMTGVVRKLLFEKPSGFDPRKFLTQATKAAYGISRPRYEAFGCAGRAARIKVVPFEAMAEPCRKGGLDAGVK